MLAPRCSPFLLVWCTMSIQYPMCLRPAYKRNGRCGLHGGQSTGARTPEGLQRISAANLKHGRYTKDKLERQRRAAEVGRRVSAEIKQIKAELMAAGLIDRKHDPV